MKLIHSQVSEVKQAKPDAKSERQKLVDAITLEWTLEMNAKIRARKEKAKQA